MASDEKKTFEIRDVLDHEGGWGLLVDGDIQFFLAKKDYPYRPSVGGILTMWGFDGRTCKHMELNGERLK